MSETKLKPCPFCGGKQAHLYNITGLFMAACKECCAKSSFFLQKKKQLKLGTGGQIMNREILFRGKNLVTHEWVQGDLFQHGDQRFIMADNRNTEVIPETVGQFTGLCDQNGVKIFEGDIIHYIDDYDDFDGFTRTVDEKAVVLWDKDYCCGFACKIIGDESGDVYSWLDFMDKPDLAVIGNIYDNPELIGGDSNA